MLSPKYQACVFRISTTVRFAEPTRAGRRAQREELGELQRATESCLGARPGSEDWQKDARLRATRSVTSRGDFPAGELTKSG